MFTIRLLITAILSQMKKTLELLQRFITQYTNIFNT
jgi:hypothetical protein